MPPATTLDPFPDEAMDTSISMEEGGLYSMPSEGLGVAATPADPWGGPPQDESSHSKVLSGHSYARKSYNNEQSINTDLSSSTSDFHHSLGQDGHHQQQLQPDRASNLEAASIYSNSHSVLSQSILQQPEISEQQPFPSSHNEASFNFLDYDDLPPPESAGAFPLGAQPTNSAGLFDEPVVVTEPGQIKTGELPPGGEWYDARAVSYTHLTLPTIA